MSAADASSSSSLSSMWDRGRWYHWRKWGMYPNPRYWDRGSEDIGSYKGLMNLRRGFIRNRWIVQDWDKFTQQTDVLLDPQENVHVCINCTGGLVVTTVNILAGRLTSSSAGLAAVGARKVGRIYAGSWSCSILNDWSVDWSWFSLLAYPCT